MASDLIVSVVLGADGRRHLPGPADGTSSCGVPANWRRWREAPKATPCPTCFPEENRRG